MAVFPAVILKKKKKKYKKKKSGKAQGVSCCVYVDDFLAARPLSETKTQKKTPKELVGCELVSKERTRDVGRSQSFVS